MRLLEYRQARMERRRALRDGLVEVGGPKKVRPEALAALVAVFATFYGVVRWVVETGLLSEKVNRIESRQNRDHDTLNRIAGKLGVRPSGD